MKNIYIIICVSFLSLISLNSKATTHLVVVGTNGVGAANAFLPSTFTASIGDTVTWTLLFNAHTATSSSVPAGALTFDSGPMTTVGGMFSYVITTAGTYNYVCSFHPNMVANFTVAGSVGIADYKVNSSSLAYPNPFTDKLSINYNGINKIELMNVLGEQVKSIEMGGSQGTLEMNFDGMPSGIYFYSTYKEGIVSETRKIVKSK